MFCGLNEMNANLEQIIKIYSTQSHKKLAESLLDFSKDDLIALFVDLLTIYINDKNSSTLREFVTVSLSGYSHNTKKIGFNGFRQTINGIPINCEAKPKNICTQDFIDYKNGLRKNSPDKLNASGNFTDYTWARLEKDKVSNLNMLVSGFIDGQLVYILEFPFCTDTFIQKLEEQLKKRFPDGDKSGEYLRSASFSFKDFTNKENLKCVYVIEKKKLESMSPYINSSLYEYLLEKAND